MRKNYILDANILIHDPQSVLHFADNTVLIPVGVLTEIDRFKKEMTDRGFNARAVVRLLDSLRGEQSLAEGVTLVSGGRLRVYCEPDRLLTGDNGHADAEILRIARRIQDAEPQTPVVIVTKDINLRIRADAAGLRAEDYESDRVPLTALRSGQSDRVLSHREFTEFKNEGRLAVGDESLTANEYYMLRESENGRATALARVDGDGRSFISLKQPEKALWGLKPRNREQYFAMDALLDERIHLVTLMGKAGTGKTILAMAAAMHQTLRQKRFRCVLVGRPVVPLGRDIGYLPGDIASKLDPWMKPIVDTVEFLLDSGGAIHGHKDAESLMRAGQIEIQPLTYIRGRSIANRFVVIDEAQNLTPLEVKTVITRVGQDAKIVLTGDPYQIDNPYVDASSNGFTCVANRFRGQSIAAHVELHKGERSALAELAANLL